VLCMMNMVTEADLNDDDEYAHTRVHSHIHKHI
jgi:hypothetical protein